VQSKSGHFHPEKFEDSYEKTLHELIAKKQAGERIEAPKAQPSAKVINLMDALKRSISAEGTGAAGKPRAATRRTRSNKPSRRPTKRTRKAG
jgi:DNA end-binding protein Ku